MTFIAKIIYSATASLVLSAYGQDISALAMMQVKIEKDVRDLKKLANTALMDGAFKVTQEAIRNNTRAFQNDDEQLKLVINSFHVPAQQKVKESRGLFEALSPCFAQAAMLGLGDGRTLSITDFKPETRPKMNTVKANAANNYLSFTTQYKFNYSKQFNSILMHLLDDYYAKGFYYSNLMEYRKPG